MSQKREGWQLMLQDQFSLLVGIAHVGIPLLGIGIAPPPVALWGMAKEAACVGCSHDWPDIGLTWRRRLKINSHHVLNITQ